MNKQVTPQPGDTWEHIGSPIRKYRILAITNEAAVDHEKWPITVVYTGEGKVWSRPLDRFLATFIRTLPDLSGPPEGRSLCVACPRCRGLGNIYRKDLLPGELP